MNERELIESIDCNFPYDDMIKAFHLIDQAKGISDNAAFMVLYEIVGAPEEVSREKIEALYHYWRSDYQHQLLVPVMEATETLINGPKLSVEHILELMSRCQFETGQYNALNILHCACDDIEGKVNEMYNQIVEHWRSA